MYGTASVYNSCVKFGDWMKVCNGEGGVMGEQVPYQSAVFCVCFVLGIRTGHTCMCGLAQHNIFTFAYACMGKLLQFVSSLNSLKSLPNYVPVLCSVLFVHTCMYMCV